MARIGTPNLDLGTYALGENPGAGPQNVSETNPANAGKALNGDRIKLDIAIGTGHNANGTHKDDVIDGNSLKSTVADGTTLETSASSGAKSLRLKAGGVGTSHLAAGAVTTAKMAADSVDATILKDDASIDANRAVTTNHIRDAAATTAKIADAAVTGAKQSNRSRALGWITLFDSQQISALTAGAEAAALSEWVETSTTYKTKLRGVLPTNITQLEIGKKYYLKVIASAKASAASGWKGQLTAGGSSVADTGINTSYDALADGTREFIVRVQLSDGSADGGAHDSNYEWSLQLGSQAGATAYMTNVWVGIVVED